MRTAATLLAVLLLAACGGDALSPRDALVQAQRKTAQVKTYRMSLTGTTTIPQAGRLDFEGNGEFDATARRGHTAMDMEQVGEVEVVMDKLVMYLRMDLLRQQAPELKPWIELDLQRVGKEVGVDFQSLMQLGQQQNPTQSLQQLRAAGEVEEVGEELVRGEETTHYRTTVDLERQAQLVQRNNPRAADSIRNTVKLTGQRKVPMEIWVDGDQLVRRMKWTQKLPAGDEKATTTTTMELYDFGADVEIELPPPNQVTTFEELTKLTQAGGTG
jgi:hypothetical protein